MSNANPTARAVNGMGELYQPPRHEEARLAPASVLLVDDDPHVRERLQLILEAAGYEVCIAGDGAEALAILRSKHFPLLLTDNSMPVMTGQELCRAIRATPLPGYVYTIMLSVRDQSEDVVAGLCDGADDFISKRAGRAELLARLFAGRRIAGLEQLLRERVKIAEQMTNIDAGTGAYNQRHVQDALGRELARSLRYGHYLSVLLCELDATPDSSDPGECLNRLRAFIARLESQLRNGSDWVARWSERQVVIALPETQLDQAYNVANRIRTNLLADPLEVGASHYAGDVSIGIASASPATLKHGVTVSSILDVAEQCLKVTRVRGRYRIVTRDLSVERSKIVQISATQSTMVAGPTGDSDR